MMIAHLVLQGFEPMRMYRSDGVLWAAESRRLMCAVYTGKTMYCTDEVWWDSPPDFTGHQTWDGLSDRFIELAVERTLDISDWHPGRH